MKKEAKIRLRCRPGDLVRIKSSWNSLLVGRSAFVRRAYSECEWVINLLGEPALVPSEDGARIIVARSIIADDWALEPLIAIDTGSSARELTCSSVRAARPQWEEVAGYI
ncbi:hypothetical protein BOC40_11725 [Burkholderia pseudomallei]|nr:hypothetical protein BOC40_11725 [Burkholderia pseudomallei]ARL45424.1 hypothetical protein BOC50_20155 [Burkholderia pseudomallei]